MAMTVRGFDSAALQFNEASWAEYQRRGLAMANVHGVWTGGTVTPGTGRAVNVAVVDGIVPGVWFVSDAVTVVPIAANAGTNRRVDYIVAEADWAANTVTIRAVAGVAARDPVAPALTQTAGTLWQMPLARVTVAGNAATIADADVENGAPRRLQFTPYSLTPRVESVRGSATAWRWLGTVTVPDPGRPYRLQVSASVRFGETTAKGYMLLRAIDADTEKVYGQGLSGNVASGRTPAVMSAQASDTLTGSRRVRLEMLPSDEFTSTSETLQVLDHGSNHFTVLPLPA